MPGFIVADTVHAGCAGRPSPGCLMPREY